MRVQALSEDELFHVLTFLGARELLAASHCCASWRALADDPTLWRRQCAELWRDKAYVPVRFQEAAAESSVVSAVTPLERKQAYWHSLRDARRTQLRVEELCAFTWERVATDVEGELPGHTERADPAHVLGDVCTFTQLRTKPYGVMMAMPGRAGYGIAGGAMKWKISQHRHPSSEGGLLVTCVSNGPPVLLQEEEDEDEVWADDDQFYPPKPVWRTPSWGWRMQNHFACYSMIGTTVRFREEIRRVRSLQLRKQQPRVWHYVSASSEEDQEGEEGEGEEEEEQEQENREQTLTR
jgi:hypothetical protein